MQVQFFVGVIAFVAIASVTSENDKITPPVSLKEHWTSKHTDTLSRVYLDNHVAVYYDADMDPFIAWPFFPLSAAWKYVKETYGQFGPDPHLYLVLHEDKKDFCLTGSYLQSRFDHRNIIDCGTLEVKNIEVYNPAHFQALLTNLVEVVSQGAKGMLNDADLKVAGDGMWSVMMYDVYLHLSEETDGNLKQWKKETMSEEKEGIHWFRDWFLPIYENYGGASVLNNFYEVTKANLKREKSGNYKSLNMGEFVHFWSEAAGVNLRPLAGEAFNWRDVFESEFAQAKIDYPTFSYSECGWTILQSCILFGILVSILIVITIGCRIKVARDRATFYNRGQVPTLLTSDDDDEDLIKPI